MKKSFLSVLITATLFVACNNKDGNNAPDAVYNDGDKIVLSVKMASDGNENNSPTRMISGTHNETWHNVGFEWKWEGLEDILIIEPLDTTTAAQKAKRQTFTMTEYNPTTQVATFEGTMPEGWTKGTPVRVVAGDTQHTLPTSTPIVDMTGGIANNAMRFEDTISTIDQQIELNAVWGAYRFPVGAKVIWAGTGSAPSYGTVFDFYFTTVEILQGSKVLYTYTLNQEIQVPYNNTTQQASYLLYIAKPGQYTDFTVRVSLDLSKCGTSAFEPVTDTPSSFSKTAYSDESTKATITLVKNQYLETPQLLCTVSFKEK